MGANGAKGGADLDISASVEPASLKVGEFATFTVRVVNRGKEATEIREAPFGRDGLEFDLSPAGGKKFRFTRINGSVYAPEKPKALTLAPGKELTATARIPALFAGSLTITGILWGRVQLETLKVEVEGAGSPAWAIDTDQGTMTAKLRPDLAPNTVANLFLLAKDGYYQKHSFHRIIKGFMIQGGCPKGEGTGGPGFSLPAEFNKLKHGPGVLSMARSSEKDSAGSQFFVVHGDASFLDNQYTGFGELVAGQEVLEKLANTPVRSRGGEASEPVTKPAIRTIRAEVVP